MRALSPIRRRLGIPEGEHRSADKQRGEFDVTLPPVPWASLRELHWWARRALFTKDPPPGPALFVSDAELADVDLPDFVTPPPADHPAAATDPATAKMRALLGVSHFAPGWRSSYNYRGEDLNLARPFFWPYSATYGPHGERCDWWQCHVRGWSDEVPDGIELAPHIEPTPGDHPAAHAVGTGLDREPGIETLGDILERWDIAYERRER